MDKYVNATEMIKNLQAMKEIGYDSVMIDGIIKGLEDNSVDAVEVIYCQDCSKWTEIENVGYGKCNMKIGYYTEPNEYCAKEKFKGEEE